jgi:tetratricopeptide (TPR) repeat protein
LNTRCYAEPVDLNIRPASVPDPTSTRQLQNIGRLFVARNWEGAIRLVDQQLCRLESNNAFERAIFEYARGFALDKLGKPEEAIRSYRSALSGFLSPIERKTSGVSLTMKCFDALADLLVSTGSYGEAVTVRRMAVKFIHALADEHPEHKPRLVQSLLGLGNSLIHAEDGAGALSALQDAHTLLQQLRGSFVIDFDELTTQITPSMVVAYQLLGRWSDALPLSEQIMKKGKDAIEAAKQSGSLNDRMEEFYAHSLCRYADNLSGVGRTEESLAAHEQSISIFRRLHERNPTERSLQLATILHNYSLQQAPQRQFILMKEGLDLLQGQSAEEDRLRIKYLTNMSMLLREAGRDGVKDAREAVETADRLAASEPAVCWKLRIYTRDTLSQALGAAHREEESLTVLKELIDIRRAHVPRNNATARDVTELVDDLANASRLVLSLAK